MRHGPAADEAVEVGARMRLITGATAGVGRAADEELVAEDQLLVRAPRPTGRLRGPPRRPGVRRGVGDRLVLRVGRVVGVAGVDEANVSHPPAPDEIASAAGQREEMIALDDVRAETDTGPGRAGRTLPVRGAAVRVVGPRGAGRCSAAPRRVGAAAARCGCEVRVGDASVKVRAGAAPR